jgi:hypothetical protein
MMRRAWNIGITGQDGACLAELPAPGRAPGAPASRAPILPAACNG